MIMAKVTWKGQAKVRSLGAVDPTGQPWNNATYNYCIGPAIQSCGEQFASQPELLQQCIDNEQAKCIQKAKNAPTLDAAGVKALQVKINNALAQYGYCPIGVDGKLGPETCGAAGWAVKTDPSITVPAYCNTVKPVLNLKDCAPKPGGGGGGGPVPQCSDNKPCPTGKECFGGKCLDKCPTGYTRDAAGLCQPPTPTTGGPSEGTSWGVIALAGAALAGLYFALRPPKDLAAPENRLGDNPRAKKTKKTKTYGKYSVLTCTPKGLVAQGSFPSARRAHQVAEQQGVTNYQVRQFNTGKCHAPVFERSTMPITPAPVLAVRENPLPYYSVVTCSSNGFLIRGRFKSPSVAHKVAKQAGLKKGQYEVRSFDVRDCVKPVQGYLDNPGCSDCDSCECEG